MSESQNLKQRMASLSDEDLVRMVTEDAADYRGDALDFAKAELRSRGVDFSAPPGDDPEEADTDASVDPILPSAGRRDGCPACGGPLRVGTLTGERELSIVFSDNHEERFVLASACGRCGLISLVVDLETEVGR